MCQETGLARIRSPLIKNSEVCESAEERSPRSHTVKTQSIILQTQELRDPIPNTNYYINLRPATQISDWFPKVYDQLTHCGFSTIIIIGLFLLVFCFKKKKIAIGGTLGLFFFKLFFATPGEINPSVSEWKQRLASTTVIPGAWALGIIKMVRFMTKVSEFAELGVHRSKMEGFFKMNYLLYQVLHFKYK